MLQFSIKRLRLGRFHMKQDQMARIGQAALVAEADRISRGVNVNDSPAKPLAPGYAKAKIRRGLAPIRDLRFTGALLGSRRITESADGRVEISIAEASQSVKAATNERIEPMLGLSPIDRTKVDPVTAAEVKQSVKAISFSRK